MRHAYLIIAHNNFEQLQMLVNLLDDKRNSIFVHIDRKCLIPKLSTTVAPLHVLYNREDVRWGDYSLVKAELNLLEAAIEDDDIYDYYHLISGVDLPIKSNDDIDAFYSQNNGQVFVTFSSDAQQHEADFRLNKYHFLTKLYRIRNTRLQIFINVIRRILEVIVNFCIKRKKIKALKGDQWFSIPHDCALFLISKKQFILKRFKYTCCPDEEFCQTLLWNTPFNNRFSQLRTREIDWSRGLPYTWGGQDDINFLLIKSDRLFARKFDINKYPDIVYTVYKTIREKNLKCQSLE